MEGRFTIGTSFAALAARRLRVRDEAAGEELGFNVSLVAPTAANPADEWQFCRLATGVNHFGVHASHVRILNLRTSKFLDLRMPGLADYCVQRSHTANSQVWSVEPGAAGSNKLRNVHDANSVMTTTSNNPGQVFIEVVTGQDPPLAGFLNEWIFHQV